MKNGRIDNTIQIEQLFDLLRTSNLLEGKVTDLKLEDIIFLVEKYFDPTCTLQTKLSADKFEEFVQANPQLIKQASAKVEKEGEDPDQDGAGENAEGSQVGEDAQQNAEGSNEDPTTPKSAARDPAMVQLEADWKQDIVNAHLVYIKGLEITYQEFKEILFELSLRMQDQIDSQPGKLKALVKKFLDDFFLKRLKPFIKFNVSKTPAMVEEKPVRKWPASQKDETIKTIMAEVERKRAEEQRIRDEEAAQQAEIDAQLAAEREAQLEAEKAKAGTPGSNREEGEPEADVGGFELEMKQQQQNQMEEESDEEDEDGNDSGY